MDWDDAAADRVAQALRADAGARDRAGLPPRRELELLRASGLLALLNPVARGGGGSFGDAFRAVRTIARADTGIARLLSYHYLHLINALRRASPAQSERLSGASVSGRWF